ncbi:MAG: polysaccharide deacetylase family protein [Verrucomicrobia bacterium]|nr:polysaccharide deacetylase family protein [Verrucomicrobiota bacterium]
MEQYSPALLVLLYHSFFEEIRSGGWEQASLDYMTTYDRFNRDIVSLKNDPRVRFTTPNEFFRMSDCTSDGIYIYVTFDDGYKSILPALQRLKEEAIPAAVFVNSGFIGTSELAWPEKLLCFFHHLGDRQFSTRMESRSWSFEGEASFEEKVKVFLELIRHLKQINTTAREQFLIQLYETYKFDLGLLTGDSFYEQIRLMDWNDVRWIAESGFQVGGHTQTHPILSHCRGDRIHSEIHKDKLAIENELNMSATLFAIPNGQPGDYNDEVIQVCQENQYERIFSTSHGLNFLQDRAYVLKRYDVGNFDISTDDVIEQVCTACLKT